MIFCFMAKVAIPRCMLLPVTSSAARFFATTWQNWNLEGKSLGSQRITDPERRCQWDLNGIQWGAPMHAMSCDFENFRYQILSFDHPMTIDDPWFEGSTALCLASWQSVQQRRDFVWQCAPESNQRSSDNHHWKKQMLVGCIPYFQADPADTSILLGIWWPMIFV